MVKHYSITFDSAVSPQKPFDPFEPFGLASEEAKGSKGLGKSEAKPLGLADKKPFGSTQNKTKGLGEKEKPFGKPFKCGVEPEAKGSKGSKGFKRDTVKIIGMSIDEALEYRLRKGNR